MSNRETCYNLVPKDYPIEITKEEVTSDCRIVEGKFQTPLELYLPGLVPKVAQDAHFQMIFPLQWRDPHHKPMCIHLAGTGDHVSSFKHSKVEHFKLILIFFLFRFLDSIFGAGVT